MTSDFSHRTIDFLGGGMTAAGASDPVVGESFKPRTTDRLPPSK